MVPYVSFRFFVTANIFFKIQTTNLFTPFFLSLPHFSLIFPSPIYLKLENDAKNRGIILQIWKIVLILQSGESCTTSSH